MRQYVENYTSIMRHKLQYDFTIKFIHSFNEEGLKLLRPRPTKFIFELRQNSPLSITFTTGQFSPTFFHSISYFLILFHTFLSLINFFILLIVLQIFSIVSILPQTYLYLIHFTIFSTLLLTFLCFFSHFFTVVPTNS